MTTFPSFFCIGVHFSTKYIECTCNILFKWRVLYSVYKMKCRGLTITNNYNPIYVTFNAHKEIISAISKPLHATMFIQVKLNERL